MITLFSSRRRPTVRIAVVCLIALTTAPHAAPAAQVTIDATAVGYIRRVPGETNRRYAQVGHETGTLGNGLFQTESNSYFVFDLSSVSGVITAATLRVYTSNPRSDAPQGGYWSSDPSEELLLREVTTPAATILGSPTTQNLTGSPAYNEIDAIFLDLGAGSLFGSVVMTEAAAEAVPGDVPGQPGGKIWDVSLTPAAIASLDATSGLWAVGGSLASVAAPISTTAERLFEGSVPFSTTPGRATPKPQLVLTTSAAAQPDFDGNGLVDGGDLLRWQQGLGLSGQTSNVNGDADGDGMVASPDLVLWQQSFGSPATAAVAAVPEPGSAILVVLAALVLTRAPRATQV